MSIFTDVVIPKSIEDYCDHRASVVGLIAECKDFEDEYYQGKSFKNGNLHLKFKRADLVERVNAIIAKHYGGNIISRGNSA
jgi:hypothetical protein